MKYYNRNCEELKINKRKMEYIGHGYCAKVFRYENMIFKEYYSETTHRFRLSADMFDILKDIDNPHFIKLFDIYNSMNLLEKFGYKKRRIPFNVDAYTSKYYEPQAINILYESIDYILDNFRELEELFKIFANNSICADDVKMANTVIDSNGIVIIDPDRFYISSYSKDEITVLNKKKLLNLLRNICINSTVEELRYGNIIAKIDNNLVNIEVTENTDITYEISKKLKYVKKPIDLLIK